jgi:hypothetical protein
MTRGSLKPFPTGISIHQSCAATLNAESFSLADDAVTSSTRVTLWHAVGQGLLLRPSFAVRADPMGLFADLGTIGTEKLAARRPTKLHAATPAGMDEADIGPRRFGLGRTESEELSNAVHVNFEFGELDVNRRHQWTLHAM